MGLSLIDVYRSPNIGIFMRTNDRTLLVPKGLAETKCSKLASGLDVSYCFASVAESRLLGPLVACNNNGALVSHLAEDYEMKEIADGTGLNVQRLRSKFTSVGNLVAANDKHALVSHLLEDEAVEQVKDVLGTTVERVAIGEYSQVGSLVVVTNSGAAVYPGMAEKEVEQVGSMLGVEAYATSVNRGVPFVASGLVANSKNAIAGSQTSGPELVFITRALKV